MKMATRAVRLPVPSESFKHAGTASGKKPSYSGSLLSYEGCSVGASQALKCNLKCIPLSLQVQNSQTKASFNSRSRKHSQREGNLEESTARQFDSTFEGLFDSRELGTVVPRSIGCSLSETEAAKRWTDPEYAYRSLSRGRTAQATNLSTPSKDSPLKDRLNIPLKESLERALKKGNILQQGSATKEPTRPQATKLSVPLKQKLEKSQSGLKDIYEKVLSKRKDCQVAPDSSKDRRQSKGQASLASGSIRASSHESEESAVKERRARREAAFVSTAKGPVFVSSNTFLTGREPQQRVARPEPVVLDRSLRSHPELNCSTRRTIVGGGSSVPTTSYGRIENVKASSRKQSSYGARLESPPKVEQRESQELLTKEEKLGDHPASHFGKSSRQRRPKISSQNVRDDAFRWRAPGTVFSRTEALPEDSGLEEPGRRQGLTVLETQGVVKTGLDLNLEAKANKRVEQLRGGLEVQDAGLKGTESVVAEESNSRPGVEKQVSTESQEDSSSLDDAMRLFVKGLGASQGGTDLDLSSRQRQSTERVSYVDQAQEELTKGSPREGNVRGFGKPADATESATRRTFVGKDKQLRSQGGSARNEIAAFYSPGRSDKLQPPPSELLETEDPFSDVISTSAESLGKEELPETAFYDENFLTRFQYTRPPPNRNLPLFLDVRKSGTAPEQPMPPAWHPKRSSHEGSGPLPGYPLGRVPRSRPPGPFVDGKPPEFWVVNPRTNKLVIPWAIKESPRGIAPGVKKVVKSWADKGPMTREGSLGAPLTNEEAAELIESCVHSEREVYLGRDGLTWNMVRLIHSHWRRRPVCKVKCKGIYTVDMAKLIRNLEASTGGQVIWRQGGTVLLFRGRNFAWKEPPIVAPPEERSASKERTQESHPIADRNPDGMGKLESLQLKKRMNRETPLAFLDKNGYYGGLVHQIRERFREPTGDLAVIKCPGFVYGDIVRLAAQLKDLVPASVFYLDKDRKQQIVLYRHASWQYLEDASTEVARTDARPAYYPKGPPPRQKRTRDYLEEEVLREVEVADEEWSSWGSVFEGPSADMRRNRAV